MKTYKQVTQEVVDTVSCDKCGKVVKEYYNDSDGRHSIYHSVHAYHFVTFYGDGYSKWSYKINDLCEDCLLDLGELLLKNGFIDKIEKD